MSDPDITVDRRGNVKPRQIEMGGAPPADDAPRSPDHVGAVATRKAGVEGWVWCVVEAVGRDFVLEGGVPRLLKTGKRKGRLTWKDAEMTTVVVTAAEKAAEEERYERDEKKCYRCGGSGKQLAGWMKAEGLKYRGCSRCNCTGRPWPPGVVRP